MNSLRTVLVAGAAAAALMSPGLASAQQPLGVTVNPFYGAGQVARTAVGLPGQVFTDPFGIPRTIVGLPLQALGVDTSGPVINEPAAKALAVNDATATGEAVLSTGSLPAVGPRARAGSPNVRPIVLRVGAIVPGDVTLAPARDVSVPGLVPNARYEYFVTQQNRVVFVDPATRTVVRIVRG